MTPNNIKTLYPVEEEPEAPTPQAYRILPAELQEYLNMMTAKCPKCPGEICKDYHLEEKHNIMIPNYGTVMREIETRTEEAKIQRLSRKDALQHVGSFIKPYIVTLHEHLNPVAI